MSRVATLARSGTLIHALIVYSAKHMPARPGIYKPCDVPDDDNGTVDQLAIRCATDEKRYAPKYTPNTLMRCMQGYRIERAVLLNTGIQEYLFRIT